MQQNPDTVSFLDYKKNIGLALARGKTRLSGDTALTWRRPMVFVRVNGRAIRIPACELARIIVAGTVPALPGREVRP